MPASLHRWAGGFLQPQMRSFLCCLRSPASSLFQLISRCRLRDSDGLETTAKLLGSLAHTISAECPGRNNDSTGDPSLGFERVKRHRLAPPFRSFSRHGWINRCEPFVFQRADDQDQDRARITVPAAAVSIVGGNAIWSGWSKYRALDCRPGLDFWCRARGRPFYQCPTGRQCIFITNVLDGDFFTDNVSRGVGGGTAPKGKNTDR